MLRKGYYTLSSRIRTRKKHLQCMLRYFSQFVSEAPRINNRPVFFGSYGTLMRVCGLGRDRNSMSQSLTLFALLGMLVKVEPTSIPEKEQKKARAIAAKYGHQRLTGFYQFNECSVETLKEAERRAIILKENKTTLAGLSRELVLRTFGEETANEAYPQYRRENGWGTTNKSNSNTGAIVKRAKIAIEEHGFIIEAELRKSVKSDRQWVRSIAEVLRNNRWEKVKLNKARKLELGVAGKGYPYIIVPKEGINMEDEGNNVECT